MPAMRWLKSLTTDAWLDLLRENPPDPKPSPRATWEVLGLYLVAGIVLALNYYAAGEMYLLMPGEWTQSDLPGARRIIWVSSAVFFYIVPPVLYLKLVMRRSLRDMGLSFRGIGRHWPLYVLFAAVVFPLVFLVSGTPHFLATYPMARDAADNGTQLLVWLVVYALQFVGLEFFFRGFLVLGPARVLGAWSIPVMVIPYLTLHFQKPYLEAIAAVFAGMALGMVVMKTRSIFVGILFHITVAWLMEVMALYHTGKLSRLFGGN